MKYLKHLLPLSFLLSAISCSKSTIPKPIITKTFAYVGGFNDLSLCNVNQQTGKWDEGCQDSGFIEFANAQNITVLYPTTAIVTLGSQTYAYIINSSDGKVYQCVINPTTGLLTGCAFSGATGFISTEQNGIAAHTAQNGNTYIYIRANDGTQVSQCTINGTTGQLSCNSPFAFSFTGDSPSIVFNTIGGNTYVYLPNASDGIQRCTVTASGVFDLSSCTTQDNTQWFVATNDIAFATFGNQVIAYITNYSSTPIGLSECTVSAVDGSLFDCGEAFGNNYSEFVTSLFLDKQWFIYTDAYTYYGANVIECSVNNSTGGLKGCADAGPGNLFSNDGENGLRITFATLIVKQ